MQKQSCCIEIIKEIAKVMTGFCVFDGKTGLTNSTIAIVFPGEFHSNLLKVNPGIQKVTGAVLSDESLPPIRLDTITDVELCPNCRGRTGAVRCSCNNGTTTCCECGSPVKCKDCRGSGFLKKAGEPCLYCMGTGFDAGLLPVELRPGLFISAKHVAFLQKYWPDVVFFAGESHGVQPVLFKAGNGIYGAVMPMAGVTDHIRIYKNKKIASESEKQA